VGLKSDSSPEEWVRRCSSVMAALSSGTPAKKRRIGSLVFSLPSSWRRSTAAAVNGFVIEPRLKTESGPMETPRSRSARP
jgi:hypothetical protein